MSYRRHDYNPNKIGRQLQFFDLNRFSNKRLYWGDQQKNQGFLTSEQIAYLKKKKQEQRKKIIYANNDYQVYQSQNNMRNISHRNYQLQSTIDVNPNEYQQKQLHVNPSLKKRIHSQMKDYEQPSIYNSYKELNKQQNNMLPDLNNMGHKRNNSSLNHQRNKTQGDERYQNQMYQSIKKGNPQSLDSEIKVALQKQYPRNRSSQKNRHNNIDSGNIKVNVEPQNHHYQNSPQRGRQQQEQQQNYFRSNLNIQENMSAAPRKLQVKEYIRTKLRRDHSPTYCNSIDYPLKCFRYV